MTNRVFRRLYRLPLRAHLLMMAFLLALPAILLIVQSGLTQRSEAMRKGFQEARRLAKAIAKEQYNLTGNVVQLLMALEQIPEIEQHDAVASNKVLASLIKKNTQFKNIIIADRHGNVWASALPMATPFSIRDKRSFRQAVRTRHFSSGEFRIGEVSGKPTIDFGYPIISSRGEIEGVITANIDFEPLRELLHTDALPEGSAYSIVDRSGVIVARSLDPDAYVGTRLRPDRFLRMKNGRERETFIASDLSDDERIISYQKMQLQEEEDPYLYVRTVFPLEKVLEKARRAFVINIATLSSLLLAAVFSVIYLGNVFFVKRIDKLQEAAHRFANGDLDARVADAGEGGEIGRLGEVFNDMASKLSGRQADLSELNHTLTKRVESETDRRLRHERLLARNARFVAMGEMIGAIAHQWRQPLATLGATVQSIRMAWERGCLNSSFLQKAEADAQKQLYYMSDTIEDFRNFFRPEKVAESFDVRARIDEVLMLASPQFAHSGVTLRSCDAGQDRPLFVKGYQNEFKQSLLNLISNAFDAIVAKGGPGGGSFAEIPGMVTVSTRGENGKVVVEVADNGCGIAPEHEDKVFDPYFTTKSVDKGTGIGLYMTRLIIEESMGGCIGFTSSREGTLFRIELPGDDGEQEVPHG